jgi:predicted N-acyltransferase
MDGLDRSLFDAPHCGIELQVAECMKDINREHWNRVVWESGGEGCTNPFLSWEFLNALEESESAHKDTGWAPQHLLAYDQESGEMVGCVPQYLKAHSYGEYVFDHTWARAYRMFTANGYYPKLQACVPFTPVTGPRLMARGPPALQKRAISCLVSAIQSLCNKSGISSAHVTFPTKSEWEVMGREGTQFSCITVTKVQILTAVIAGFLQRTGIQYHWHNAGYATFQEFLETLKQSKRKSIRQERSKIRRAGGADFGDAFLALLVQKHKF